jgi:DNA-binding MarR family transcriptional regulator
MGRGLSDVQKRILCYVAKGKSNGDAKDHEVAWLGRLDPQSRKRLRQSLIGSPSSGDTARDSVKISRALAGLEARGLVRSWRGCFSRQARKDRVRLTPEGAKVARSLDHTDNGKDSTSLHASQAEDRC